jgi:hypothetical protein
MQLFGRARARRYTISLHALFDFARAQRFADFVIDALNYRAR